MDLTTVTNRLENDLTRYGLNVSPRAREILAQCIFAITDDRELVWGPPPSDLDMVQENAIHGLTLKLNRLIHTMSQRGIPLPEGQLRTFTILHHLSSWIDHLCPFEKSTGQTAPAPPTPTP